MWFQPIGATCPSDALSQLLELLYRLDALGNN